MREVSASDEMLIRIGVAVIEVDRLRERQAAAKRARNKISCRREGGRHQLAEPCWKQWVSVPPYGEDIERLDLESQCAECQRRYIRQQAYAAESRRLAGARRRVTMLARRFRRDF